MAEMRRKEYALLMIFIVLFGGFSSASATSPQKIVTGFLSNSLSNFLNWIWSLSIATKTAISDRPMMKFESGYTVETVFDGSKLGIEPFSVEVLPSGSELLVLDSVNSNIYKIASPLSLYSRPKLVAGSMEGYPGHVDGKPREARMNHPKGLTLDDRGNIYVADTMNMAIRKISDAGVTTIAGGKWSTGAGHVDGPSEDAKFSNDFEVVYIGSSCSLLVIDRGNQAIREIQLHFEDCAYQYETGIPLGIAVLAAASFFGYMLALLQRRVGAIVSSKNEDPRTPRKPNFLSSPYQKPSRSSIRPPLIPADNEPEMQEGLIASLGTLFINAATSTTKIFTGLFSSSKKSLPNNQHQNLYQQWPLQDSFVIKDEDDPPSPETRTPTAQKTYPFMEKEPEKSHHLHHSRAYYRGWDGNFQQHYQYQQQHYSLGLDTYYEQCLETTEEIVFGAVQEQDGQQGAVEIKAVDYSDPMYDHHNIRHRISYMGHAHDY